MAKISELRGLGEISAAMLAEVGIDSEADLNRIGPVEAFVMVRDQTDHSPSKNLLYAMIGALEDKDWKTIAREQKSSLVYSLEGYEKLQALFKDEGY